MKLVLRDILFLLLGGLIIWIVSTVHKDHVLYSEHAGHLVIDTSTPLIEQEIIYKGKCLLRNYTTPEEMRYNTILL